MSQQPDTMDVELLIVKVKENSAIYDASDKNHSNRNFIASVWKNMGEELNTSGEFYVIVIINYYINISMVTNYKITSPQRKFEVVTV